MVSHIIMREIRRISKRSDICYCPLPAMPTHLLVGSSPRSAQWTYPSPGDPLGLIKNIIDFVAPCDDPVVDERTMK